MAAWLSPALINVVTGSAVVEQVFGIPGMKADGLILLGYGDYLAYQGKLQRLVEQGTRFVRWGAVLPDQPGLSIGCENLGGGRQAGAHLVALGRRRVAFLGDASSHYPEFLDRFLGCEQALHEYVCKLRGRRGRRR